jgi:hypothetical protein
MQKLKRIPFLGGLDTTPRVRPGLVPVVTEWASRNENLPDLSERPVDQLQVRRHKHYDPERRARQQKTAYIKAPAKQK